MFDGMFASAAELPSPARSPSIAAFDSDGARHAPKARQGSIEVLLGKRGAERLNHALGIAVLPDIAANGQPDRASFGRRNDIGERLALGRPLWPAEYENRNRRGRDGLAE